MDRPSSSETTIRAAVPCWGALVCDVQGWSFDDVFRHQFRISQRPTVASSLWKTRKLGSFSIEHCPNLPATKIMNRRGQLIGWCLGIAIDLQGVATGFKDGSHLTMTATFDAVERRLSQLAGRFAVLVQIGDELRYYPDATSGLTAVANDGLETIASTVTLAINDDIQPSGGRTSSDIRGKPTLYLMDETPDARVRQLRSNHYVDLATFRSHRFWPKDDTPFEPPSEPGQSVARITERVQTIMSSLVTHFDCTIPITGGRDSRLLAAAVPRKVVDRVGSFYVHEINWSTKFDAESASRVAKHLDISLHVKRVLSGDCDAELATLNLARTRAQIGLATGYAHPHL
ncbi:MAG: hypothetical protein ABJC64_05680, partial [Paracoccaceae bacterium]